MKIVFPQPLKENAVVAVTAPSAGVSEKHWPRLDYAISNLKDCGFQVVEGKSLRHNHKGVSTSKEARAQEFLHYYRDAQVSAILPPWGGELLIEILPLLDLTKWQSYSPKWICGFSDISTLLFAITTMTGIATLHGPNLLDAPLTQPDPLSKSFLPTLRLEAPGLFAQTGSSKYQETVWDFVAHPKSPFNLRATTSWILLSRSAANTQVYEDTSFSGRMIGGCLDTISRLVGTPFGDLPRFGRCFSATGLIFYFENAEMSPFELTRALSNLKYAGWFENVNGILIGRSTGPESLAAQDLSYEEAIVRSLLELEIPILYDVDIGHKPPQLNIVNGAIGHVKYGEGNWHLIQEFT